MDRFLKKGLWERRVRVPKARGSRRQRHRRVRRGEGLWGGAVPSLRKKIFDFGS